MKNKQTKKQPNLILFLYFLINSDIYIYIYKIDFLFEARTQSLQTNVIAEWNIPGLRATTRPQHPNNPTLHYPKTWVEYFKIYTT